MSYSKEDAFRHVLSMDLNRDTFRYAILDPSSKKIIEEKAFELSDYSKQGVKPYLEEEIFQYDYQNYSLSAGTPRNTLIPTDLFAYTGTKEVFQLNYPKPHEDLDYNRIPEIGIVNIYELPLWIKSLFVIKFPRIKISHRSTVLLKGVFDQPIFSPKVHLFVEDEQFYFLITNRSKLIYYNRFDYKTLADLAYYLLFVFEQKELVLKEYEVKIYGVSNQWEHQKALEDLIHHKTTISHQAEKAQSFLLAKQLLCV